MFKGKHVYICTIHINVYIYVVYHIGCITPRETRLGLF